MNEAINAPVSLTWSGDIPALEISTSEDSLTLDVVAEGSTIQQLTLYAHNGKVTLWELRDLVESHLLDEGKYTCVVSVMCGNDSLCSFTVLYLGGVMLDDAATFCASHFLTLSQSRQLVPGIEDTIYYHGNETTATIRVTYLDEGAARVASQSVSVDGNVQVSIESLQTMFNVDTVLGATVTVGSRTMFYYVNQQIDVDYVFGCINYFGVTEVVPINCATSINQVGQRTVASVGRSAVLASLTHETEHEVETAPLSPLQSALVEQLCESPDVWLEPDGLPVVISERSCELSDERGDLQTVKFTWRTLPGRRKVNLPADSSSRIFSREYDETYG